MSTALPDQNYIDQIRRRLWCGRDVGQAAVMIGSGFSRNAEKRSSVVPDFPLWGELIQQLGERVYSSQFSDWHKTAAMTSSGALRLASEYEVLFGRQSLDELVVASIPDEQYTPGEIHKLLLSLPWSDVFTTNYDRLLEWTTPSIYEQKYDVILTPEDVPGRMRPRIVKLHGSFPAHRPFIVTEEDYRTYPQKFASFVSLVQQSMMENAFCLLGFSGDDPNFLNWTGWVRDNLGAAMPQIYLCGLHDGLTNARRQLLLQRNIVPVDLSPLFPKSEYADPNLRHFRAIAWFLLNLKLGESPNLASWPRSSQPVDISSWQISNSLDLSSIPVVHIPSFEEDVALPALHDSQTLAYRTLNTSELAHIAESWRNVRQHYPGWVVCPKSSRSRLWITTSSKVEPILVAVSTAPPIIALEVLYELNWRIETSLMPLFLGWAITIEQILKQINPFPKSLSFETEIRPDHSVYQAEKWASIEEKWVSLAFAVIREARDDQDEARFGEWIGLLGTIVTRNAVWQARWFYEQCLFYLARLDGERVLGLLNQWQVSPKLEFWTVKRAAIFAELGSVDEAQTLAKNALAEIRSRIQPNRVDYFLLSQESWVMLFLEIIQGNLLDFREEEKLREQNRERQSKLRRYQCDAWMEIESLATQVSQQIDGQNYQIYSLSNNSKRRDLSTAFELLRIFEEGAIPIRSDLVTVFPEEVFRAAKWIFPSAPMWASSVAIRTFNSNVINEMFATEAVVTLDESMTAHLYQLILNSLQQAFVQFRQSQSRRGVLFDRIVFLSKMLSKLCFRLSEQELEFVLKTALRIHRSGDIPKQRPDILKPLFAETLKALPQSSILSRMTELLLLDIPSDGDVVTCSIYDQDKVEPFKFIRWKTSSPLTYNRQSWTFAIRMLIELVNHGNDWLRETAIYRLSKLYEIDALTTEEQQALAQAIWHRLDETGLPAGLGTQLYKSIIFRLPELEPGRAKQHFQRYLLTQDFPTALVRIETPGERTGFGISYQANHYFNQWLSGTVAINNQGSDRVNELCDWTNSEVRQLFGKMVESWAQQRNEIQTFLRNDFFGIEVKNYAINLQWLLIFIILPRLTTIDESLQVSLHTFVSELDSLGLKQASLSVALLLIYPDQLAQVTESLKADMNSMQQEAVKAAYWGVYHWGIYADNFSDRMSPLPEGLLTDLVYRILVRRQPGLTEALEVVAALLQRNPNCFATHQVTVLQTALQYLLSETDLTNLAQGSDQNIWGIPSNERILCRKFAAQIAHELYRQYETNLADIPTVLSDWRQVSLHSSVAEMRDVWN